MLAIKKINPVARAIIVIGAVMALVTSVTFAALTSSATLSGNTIGTASANADLLLWNGTEFADAAPGFNFTGLTPGERSEKFNFYFKNNGNTDLDLTARVDAAPEFSEGITAADVELKFTGNCKHDNRTTVTLADLLEGPVVLPCNPLEAGAQGVIGEKWNKANYAVSVKIADSVPLSETGHTVGAFDLIFDGTAVGSTPEEPEEPETPEEGPEETETPPATDPEAEV